MADAYHVMFSGTRDGMTGDQYIAVRDYLDGLTPTRGGYVFHHGDCIGADEQFHGLVWFRGVTVGHPPTDDRQRAHCSFDVMREPHPFLTRNRQMVKESSLLIAASATPNEVTRSGTWATVRYARAGGLRIVVLGPNGQVVERREMQHAR